MHLNSLETIEETKVAQDELSLKPAVVVQDLENSIWQGANSDISSEISTSQSYSLSKDDNILPAQPNRPKPLLKDVDSSIGHGSRTEENFNPDLHKDIMSMAASVHFGENTIDVIASSYRYTLCMYVVLKHT